MEGIVCNNGIGRRNTGSLVFIRFIVVAMEQESSFKSSLSVVVFHVVALLLLWIDFTHLRNVLLLLLFVVTGHDFLFFS